MSKASFILVTLVNGVKDLVYFLILAQTIISTVDYMHDTPDNNNIMHVYFRGNVAHSRSNSGDFQGYTVLCPLLTVEIKKERERGWVAIHVPSIYCVQTDHPSI